MEVDGGALTPVLLARLTAARQAPPHCDLRLAAGPRRLPAHSTILCALSPELARLCARHRFSLHRPLTLHLGRCYPCLHALTNLLYCQRVVIPSPHPLHRGHLVALVRRLRLPDILLECLPELEKTPDLPKELPPPPPPILPRPRPKPDFKNLSGKKQSCIECESKFYKPSDLLKHLRESGHGNDICSLCLDRFDSCDDLKQHYALHDNPKPFFCTVCDVRFQTRGLLIQHLPRHSKETPYTCSLCKKGFKWKHGLNSHLMIHKNEKKHLCDECGFSTVHAKTLRAHKLTHTGNLFRCSFPGCTHTCSRKENMKFHLFTHSNDKPFVCEICGHKFSLNKSLKRHALLHGDVVHANVCPHCPFKAVRADNLKAHILRQHTEKPLTLELGENFNEIEIDHDMVDVEIEIREDMEDDENDLSVLANAASSRAKIRDVGMDQFELGCSRSFDNLISNPKT